jgi:DNA repair ATPase RecN
MVLCGVILDILFAKAMVRQNGANLLRKGATKAKQEGLYTFLRNEPTEFALENMGYQSGQQVVMEEIRERKRWVRFGKRTHWEGVK